MEAQARGHEFGVSDSHDMGHETEVDIMGQDVVKLKLKPIFSEPKVDGLSPKLITGLGIKLVSEGKLTREMGIVDPPHTSTRS
jgi:hypothetical protein